MSDEKSVLVLGNVRVWLRKGKWTYEKRCCRDAGSDEDRCCHALSAYCRVDVGCGCLPGPLTFYERTISEAVQRFRRIWNGENLEVGLWWLSCCPVVMYMP